MMNGLLARTKTLTFCIRILRFQLSGRLYANSSAVQRKKLHSRMK